MCTNAICQYSHNWHRSKVVVSRKKITSSFCVFQETSKLVRCVFLLSPVNPSNNQSNNLYFFVHSFIIEEIVKCSIDWSEMLCPDSRLRLRYRNCCNARLLPQFNCPTINCHHTFIYIYFFRIDLSPFSSLMLICCFCSFNRYESLEVIG